MPKRHILVAMTFSLTSTMPCFAHMESAIISRISQPIPVQQHYLAPQPHAMPTRINGVVSGIKTVSSRTSKAARALSSGANSSSAQPENLDLSSTSASVTAGSLIRGGSVSITVGGTTFAVTATTPLTPAEQLAVYQVVVNRQQSIVLDAQGSATGGTVTINQQLSQNLGNLVIPKGVTVIDVSKSGNLDLSGNLTDDGSLYVVAKGGAAASIEANNIVVQAQGLLTDVLPAGSNATSAAQNLSLSSQDAIANSGTITSGGSLNLTAGSGSISNSGAMRATSGNINFASGPATDINVNASGGTFQAQNGNINFRDPSYTGVGNINISGGNFISNNLNLYSGSGTISTFADAISGLLNVTAGQAHTIVSSGTLQLGTLNLTGDPTFYNTNGNITIGGNISVGEAFSAVASGNILSTGNYSITAKDGAAGADINLIAGANISAPGSTPSSVVGPTGIGTPAANPITIDGPSATGGDVTFSGHNMTISAAATSGNNAGGDVNVIAFSNAAGTNGGHVLLSSGTSINSGGSGTGANGNIKILAGATSGVAITTGSLNSAGGTGGGGDISIQTAQPTTPTAVTVKPNGDLAAGSNFVASNTVNPASVAVNAAVTSGGNVNITSANTVAVNSTISATTAGKNITIQSPSNLTLTGNGMLATTSTGTTSLLAMSSGSSLTLANTRLSVNGGGQVDIRTPNLILAGANPSITATGASNFFIDAGNSAANVDLNITGPSNRSGTIATNGGIIDISPTGKGNGNFLSSGTGATTINLNAAGSNGAGLVDVHGLGNFTIPAGVTLATNSPIQFNMNNTLGNETFTLNGVIKTTASNSTFPDPLGGTLPYSILIQNLITNYTIAGTGTILQAGRTPGNTVFNDFTDVGFANGTNLHVASVFKGGYVNFFTRQIQVNGPGATSAALSVQNMNAVNFNSNLPSPGPGDVAFVGGPTATSANFTITGAPVNVGFTGAPPVSIPEAQQPLGNITIGNNFTLTASNPISLNATNMVLVQGTLVDKAGNGQLTAQSPTGEALDISGNGVLHSPRIVLNSPGGPGVNFNGDLSLLGGPTYIGATNGAVTISSGSSVKHAGAVFINSPGGIPSGFDPAGGVFQINRSPNPNRTAISITAPNLVVPGTISAVGAVASAASGSHSASLSKSAAVPAATAPQVSLEGRVSKQTPVVAEASFSGSSFTNNKLSELASRGIIFGQNSDSKSLNLIKGNVLFTPESDISVQTNAGTAYIPRGAAAWIVHNGASVAVYDLHDSARSGRIKVVAGNKELSLAPGSQAVLSKDQTASFDSLNAGNTIAYSNVREGKLGAGTKIFVADFSIPHGLASISVVRNLLESPDAAQRKVAWTMIKDAAILNDLAGSDFQ